MSLLILLSPSSVQYVSVIIHQQVLLPFSSVTDVLFFPTVLADSAWLFGLEVHTANKSARSLRHPIPACRPSARPGRECSGSSHVCFLLMIQLSSPSYLDKALFHGQHGRQDGRDLQRGSSWFDQLLHWLLR